MSGCTVQRLEAPGLTFLKVSGTVDETFSASQLSGQIRADTILHLGKVTRFSSFGVREWVRLMKDLQGRVKHCILVECSPAVVNQLNVVVDFAAGAHVKSVQLPYACQRCELDKMVTVDVDAQRSELLAGTLPQVPCPQCKNPMVFDDLPGSYLAFLRDSAPAEPGSPMSRFIASFEQAAPKLADMDVATGASAAAAAPAPPAAPAIDPTVPPPGMAPAGGGMKWAAIAVVGLAVVVGGIYVFRPVAPAPPPPTPPTPVATPTPPPPPPRRDISGTETVKLNQMLNARSFTEAEAFITKMEPVWLEETTTSMRNSLQEARFSAQKEEIALARKAQTAGNLQEANEHLEKAEMYAKETDELLLERIKYFRKKLNCPAVLATVEQMAQLFPTSLVLKKANDHKRVCLAQPAVGPKEVQSAIKLRQPDIDGCLKAPLAPDQTASSIEVAWTVGTTGNVTAASCTTPALARSTLCECLTSQVKQLHFSEKVGTQFRRANFAFTLGAAGLAGPP